MTLGEIIFLVFAGIILAIFVFAAVTNTIEARLAGQDGNVILLFWLAVLVIILCILLGGFDSVSDLI